MLYALIFFQNSKPSFENSVDPDQLASDEASWSASTLFSSICLDESTSSVVKKRVVLNNLKTVYITSVFTILTCQHISLIDFDIKF